MCCLVYVSGSIGTVILLLVYCSYYAQCPCCESRESETIQHTLFECSAFTKEHDTFLERLYELHPIARGLSPEGHCNFLMGDDLPHETENTVFRYLIAISKLRLGILTEQGEGS